MKKLKASILKEFQLLLTDKVGLLLMYLMPILLVFIITLVQDSTFKLVNENKLEILIVNDDKGVLGDSLIAHMGASGAFAITIEKGLNEHAIQKRLIDGNELIAVAIPPNFSQFLETKATNVSVGMLQQFELAEESDKLPQKKGFPLVMYYDPVLQEGFRMSVLSSLHTHVTVLENKLMIEQLYVAMGYDEIPGDMKKQFTDNHLSIEEKSASTSNKQVIPNSSQHNVPAWSIFAMFFMVISLGGNIVKERVSGSFIRLQTIPASFSLVLVSKMFTYGCVALTQLAVIFGIGKFVFPLIGLPALSLPDNLIGLVVVSFLSALAAISFAMLVGTYAKTQEQANGFGAISIIILAAIGGIWVPSFVMPSYLQTIGKLSPLHWCLEGYYTLFLKGGDWYLLLPALLFLIIFIFACQIAVYIKLRLQNYI